MDLVGFVFRVVVCWSVGREVEGGVGRGGCSTTVRLLSMSLSEELLV